MKVISSSKREAFFQNVVLVLMFLVLILAVTGWFVVRSNRFRLFAEEQLSHRTGVPMRVADSYIGWPYVVVLRGVTSQNDFAAAQIQIRELRLGRSLRRWNLQIRGARIAFVPDALESVTHAVSSGLMRMSRLRDAGAIDVMRATESFQNGWRIQLDDVDLLWMEPDGVIMATVPQIHFLMAPVQLPSERMIYYELRYPGAAQNALGSVEDLDWKWMTRGGEHYVEILRKGRTPDVVFEPSGVEPFEQLESGRAVEDVE